MRTLSEAALAHWIQFRRTSLAEFLWQFVGIPFVREKANLRQRINRIDFSVSLPLVGLPEGSE